LIKVEEAQKLILKEVKICKIEKVKIIDSLGYVLAENIYSPFDIPNFDNSAMDGFAIKSEETKFATLKNPAILKIVGDLPAGEIFRKTLKKKEAVKIMTGAILPKGADAVVKVEDVKVENGKVKIFNFIKKFENVRFKGEDLKKGELILKKGTIISPSVTGILARIGKSIVKVIGKPKVGIFSTGNELLEVGEKLKLGKIYNSNSYSLISQVKNCGAIPLYFGISPDREDLLKNKFEEVSEKSDVIITSGGVSVGEYDLVKNVLEKIGKIDFWSIAQRPGKPMAFGKIKNKIVFGLPGNPVSSMITFEEYVRPALLKMMGKTKLFREEKEAILEENLEKKKGFRYFLRGIFREENGTLYVKTTGPQGSGILKSFLLANCIIILPEELEKIKKGEKVKIQILD
jgi:molybdopterin molybdotransferase